MSELETSEVQWNTDRDTNAEGIIRHKLNVRALALTLAERSSFCPVRRHGTVYNR